MRCMNNTCQRSSENSKNAGITGKWFTKDLGPQPELSKWGNTGWALEAEKGNSLARVASSWQHPLTPHLTQQRICITDWLALLRLFPQTMVSTSGSKFYSHYRTQFRCQLFCEAGYWTLESDLTGPPWCFPSTLFTFLSWLYFHPHTDCLLYYHIYYFFFTSEGSYTTLYSGIAYIFLKKPHF